MAATTSPSSSVQPATHQPRLLPLLLASSNPPAKIPLRPATPPQTQSPVTGLLLCSGPTPAATPTMAGLTSSTLDSTMAFFSGHPPPSASTSLHPSTTFLLSQSPLSSLQSSPTPARSYPRRHGRTSLSPPAPSPTRPRRPLSTACSYDGSMEMEFYKLSLFLPSPCWLSYLVGNRRRMLGILLVSCLESWIYLGTSIRISWVFVELSRHNGEVLASVDFKIF